MIKKLSIRDIAKLAVLIALEVILSRFLSIATPIVKIGFGFVPVVMAAMMFGPFWGGVMGGAADLIGALLFPIGPFFPGYTLTAVLVGVVYGVFLHDKPKSNLRILFAVLIVNLVLHLCLNTFWVMLTSGKGYLAILPTRVLQCLIMAPVQFVLIRVLHTQQILGLLPTNTRS